MPTDYVGNEIPDLLKDTGYPMGKANKKGKQRADSLSEAVIPAQVLQMMTNYLTNYGSQALGPLPDPNRLTNISRARGERGIADSQAASLRGMDRSMQAYGQGGSPAMLNQRRYLAAGHSDQQRMLEEDLALENANRLLDYSNMDFSRLMSFINPSQQAATPVHLNDLAQQRRMAKGSSGGGLGSILGSVAGIAGNLIPGLGGIGSLFSGGTSLAGSKPANISDMYAGFGGF